MATVAAPSFNFPKGGGGALRSGVIGRDTADAPCPCNALTRAVLKGDVKRVQRRINEGWDVNGSDDTGTHPLLVAVKCQHVDVVQMLLDHGAKSKNKRMRTELHVLADLEKGPFPVEEQSRLAHAFQQWLGNAPHAGSIRLWKLLILAGASPTSPDRKGRTAFHLACGRGNWPVVEYLLDDRLVQGILNEPDRKGDTPLLCAARYGHRQVVMILLSRGADSLVEGRLGNAAEVAKHYGHHDLAQAIEEWSFKAQPLLHLPYDALLHVFGYLEPHDLCAVAQVCKALHDISDADLLWHKFCDPELKLTEGMSYKKSYMSWLQPRLKQYAQNKATGYPTRRLVSIRDSSQQDCNLLKLLMVGDRGVGKTSLLNRLVNDTFSSYATTVGVEFGFKTVELEGYRIKLHVLDTTGYGGFTSVPGSYYRTTQGALLIYNMCCRDSFASIEGWVEQLQLHGLSGSLPPRLLVATKSDLHRRRQVSADEGEEMARRINAVGFCETSSLTSDGVMEAFLQMTSGALRTIDPFYGRHVWHAPSEDYLKALYSKTAPAGMAEADRSQVEKGSCLLQ